MSITDSTTPMTSTLTPAGASSRRASGVKSKAARGIAGSSACGSRSDPASRWISYWCFVWLKLPFLLRSEALESV
jgi:hypothetical protein